MAVGVESYVKHGNFLQLLVYQLITVYHISQVSMVPHLNVLLSVIIEDNK